MSNRTLPIAHRRHAHLAGPAGVTVGLAAILIASAPVAQSGSASSPPERRASAIRLVDVPAADGALACELSARGEVIVMSWLDRLGGGGARGSHALRFARLVDDMWSKPRTVVEGDGFFANWADFPSVVPGAGDTLLAHWLARSGRATYAYDVRLARSDDAGESWQRIGKLHDDDTETEHGFVSMVPDGAGFAAIWLDGRAMAAGGAMSLRASRVADRPDKGEVLDDDVCSCCQTSAVRTDGGLVAVYRDHTGEMRDISIVRRTPKGWTAPRAVHDDGWKIAGCPVNGPAVDSGDGLLAVAWFTMARRPLVQVAFSTDGGESFASPIAIDDDNPLGRVDIVCVPGGAVVSWLGRDREAGTVRLRYAGSDGAVGAPLSLGATSATRASGFPRMVRAGDVLVLGWRDAGERPRLRSALVPLGAVPRRAKR